MKPETLGLSAISAGQTAGFMGAFQTGGFARRRSLGYMVGFGVSLVAGLGAAAVSRSMLPLASTIASGVVYVMANEYAVNPGGKVPGRLRFN